MKRLRMAKFIELESFRKKESGFRSDYSGDAYDRIVGWFYKTSGGYKIPFPKAVFRMSPEEQKEFGPNAYYTDTPLTEQMSKKEGRLTHTQVIKVDPATGKIRFLNNELYDETMQVRWNRPWSPDKIGAYEPWWDFFTFRASY